MFLSISETIYCLFVSFVFIFNITREIYWYSFFLFQHHSDTDCAFATISCQFTGCDKVFQRRHRNSHEENCLHKEISCQYCQHVIKESQTEVLVNYDSEL